MMQGYLREKKIKELLELANTPDEELEKMNYKEKQAVYRAKSKLCNVVWKSNEKGTFKNTKKEEL